MDQDRLLAAFNGNRKILLHIAEIFSTRSAAMLGAISEAVMIRDAVSLARSAHTLKGALYMLRAEKAANAAVRLEAIARSGDWSEGERAYRVLGEEISRVVKELSELQALDV